MTVVSEQDLELLRAIEKGRIDHLVAKKADDMLRLAIILLRRLGGSTVITHSELASRTDDVDLVWTASGGLTDPLDGTKVWLEPSVRSEKRQTDDH